MRKPLLSELTLREKIGQTAMVRTSNMEARDPVNYPYGSIWNTGNVMMGVVNMADKASGRTLSLKEWLDFLKKINEQIKIPVLPAMDCISGIENYYYETEPFLDPVTIGAAGGAELAYEAGVLRARLMKCVGSKWLWYPEVDIVERRHAISLGRKYTDDMEKMIAMGVADVKGTQSQGVAACAKHFPSTGCGEYRDSHVTQTMSFATLEEWRAGQGAIFQKMFDAGVDSVMTTHGAFPAYDNTMVNGKYISSTTSHRIITELLKGEMGFKGVVITDGIGMRGLQNMYDGDVKRVCVEAIKAGNDVVLGTYEGYFEAIEEAVLSGEIPESRIDDACQRVLDLKEKLGLFEDDYQYASDELEQVNADIRAFKERVAKKAVSLVCNKQQLLPVKQADIKNVAIIYSGHDEEGDNKAFDNLKYLIEAFERRGAKVHMQRRLHGFDTIKKIADENDLIIYAGYLMRGFPEGFSSFYGEEMMSFWYALDSGADKSVGIGLGSPFMYFDFYSSFKTFINAYNYSKETLEAVVAAIYGEIPFEGGHPVKLIPPEMEEKMKVLGIEY